MATKRLLLQPPLVPLPGDQPEGGARREFRKGWVEPYFKKARAREIAEGGTGFKAVEAKQRFLDDMSLRIARGNAGMVMAATVAK